MTAEKDTSTLLRWLQVAADAGLHREKKEKLLSMKGRIIQC